MRPPTAALVHRRAELATDGRAKALEVKAPIGSKKSSEKKEEKGEDEEKWYKDKKDAKSLHCKCDDNGKKGKFMANPSVDLPPRHTHKAPKTQRQAAQQAD